MKEMETFKATINGQEVELSIKPASPDDVMEAEKIRAKAFNQAFLVDKMPLAIKAREEAMKQGIWNEDKQKELSLAQTELIRLENVLNKDRNLKMGGPGIDDENTMFRIALKCQELRDKIINLRTVFADIEKNTAEGYAENERQNYILYATTVYKDSRKRFFDSFEDFKRATVFTEENKEKCAIATIAYYNYRANLLDDYQKNLGGTAENKFLKRFKFVDEKGRFLNKEGKFVNVGGELVNEDGVPLTQVTPPEKPKPYLDDNGNPIIDEEYKKELEAYNKTIS